MPHDTRSNTATFLEGVISYIQTLQQSNARMEAELAALQALRTAAAANLRQQHDALAQPAGSGSTPAESSHHHQPGALQQHWRQDSISGPQPHSLYAATAMQVDSEDADPAGSLQAQQQRTASAAALTGAARQALSSSPTHAAAAAAAGGPCAEPTLSAPAALMHTLMQHSSAATAAAAAGPAAPVEAAPTHAPEAGDAVQPQGPALLQPAELQSVLEKALLAALQQGAAACLTAAHQQ